MNRTISILILFIAHFSLLNCYAQQPTQEWIAQYLGANSNCMAMDSSGNVYVSGIDSENPPGFVTVKYNTAGQQIWAKRYAGLMPIMAKPVKIGIDMQNNVYVAGYDQDYILVKYNSAGTQQWVRRYYGSSGGISNLNDMKLTKRGIVVTGYVNNAGANSDFCTIEYSSNGDTLWTAIYNTINNGYEVARAMCIDFLGNVIVTGQTANATGSYSPDFLTIKYDSNGAQQWVRRYDHLGRWDYGVDVDVNKNGSIYIFGSVQVDSNNDDFCTLKYSSGGVQQWVKTYDGPAHLSDGPKRILLDHSGNVVVAGYDCDNSTLNDFCTVKYDSLGMQQWVKRYNGLVNREDYLQDLCIDINDNIYIIGDAVDIDSAFTFRYFSTSIKYRPTGEVVWILKYQVPIGVSTSRAITADKFQNVYVSNNIGTGMLTIKYSQIIGIEEITNQIPCKFRLFQNFPNPFNPSTNIEFRIPIYGLTTLKVYDILGREIEVLVNEYLQPGVYILHFDGSGLPSGIYFYRLETENYTETKKMILVK
jgi:hypothetical protein